MARIRLRTAEDFEIKYELLTKQNSSLLQENNKLIRDLGIRKVESDQLVVEIEAQALARADLERLILAKDGEIILLLDKIKELDIIKTSSHDR